MVRFKCRYLLFEIYYPNEPALSLVSGAPTTFHTPSPKSADKKAVASKVRESIALHFGDLGAGKTGALSVKFFSHETSRGIIKCARDQFRTVWAAITFLNEFAGKTAVWRVVRVSGTIRKAEIEAIRRNRSEGTKIAESLERLIAEGDGDGEEGIIDED